MSPTLLAALLIFAQAIVLGVLLVIVDSFGRYAGSHREIIAANRAMQHSNLLIQIDNLRIREENQALHDANVSLLASHTTLTARPAPRQEHQA